MKHMYTVTPYFVALIVGIATMGLDIYQINAWNVGTLKVEPWRQKTSDYVRRITSFLSWCSALWNPRLALCAALSLALLAAHLGASPHDGQLLLAIGAGGAVTEPTLREVKDAIDAGNRLFEEYKRTNDIRIKQLETNGVVDPLITAKLEKLNKAIDDQSAINEAFIAVQAKVNRMQLNGGTATEEKRAAELKSFNATLKGHAMAVGKATPTELTADEYKAYSEAFDVFLRKGERGLSDAERKALSVGNDLAGGYLVTPDKGGRIVERVFETSPMRQYASVQPVSTDALEGLVDLDEATVGWVAELGTRSDSTTPNAPTPWKIPVNEIYSQPKASQKLVEDANIDIVAWLSKKVGDKIGRTSNAAFVTGNGTGKPRGFASYTTAATADASRAWGVFEHIATGSAGGFGTDPNGVNKLLDLIHAMKDVYAAKGAFYMNRLTLGKSRQLTDASSAGKYVFIPSFTAGQPDTFLGYPVRKMQDMATYSTTDALAIGFGDMEETYQIVDRLGISVLVDPFTSKPYVIYYTRARVGGDVLNFESMKFLKFGTS